MSFFSFCPTLPNNHSLLKFLSIERVHMHVPRWSPITNVPLCGLFELLQLIDLSSLLSHDLQALL